MRGDIVVVEKQHTDAAAVIVDALFERIKKTKHVLCISVAGESGSGKSEIGEALKNELKIKGVSSIVLGQDDYFVLPPKSNDEKRREDPKWLGPHLEVKMDELDSSLSKAKSGDAQISTPVIEYDQSLITRETIELKDIKTVIVEGTYTSLLKNVDIRIFIDRTREDTLEHRAKRNRGNEVNDPFIETLLDVEHKIIAGHKQLADVIVTKHYTVEIPLHSHLNQELHEA